MVAHPWYISLQIYMVILFEKCWGIPLREIPVAFLNSISYVGIWLLLLFPSSFFSLCIIFIAQFVTAIGGSFVDGFAVRLVHRDSPLSPPYNRSMTALDHKQLLIVLSRTLIAYTPSPPPFHPQTEIVRRHLGYSPNKESIWWLSRLAFPLLKCLPSLTPEAKSFGWNAQKIPTSSTLQSRLQTLRGSSAH